MRIIVVKSKTLLAAAIALLFSLCAIVGGPGIKHALGVGSKRLLPIYSVETAEKKVALTFDAAWGNEDTRTLIEILGRYNVRATFFVVGIWADKYPDSVKELFDAGHEIMSHSNTHPHMSRLSGEQIRAELAQSAEKIEKITGVRPSLFRAPYGEYNNLLIETAAELGIYVIQWDVDSHDWMNKSADYIVSRVVSRVREGSIVLFHNAAKNTPEALPRIIEALREKGFTFVGVSELIYKSGYTIDHTGRQRPQGQSAQ